MEKNPSNINKNNNTENINKDRTVIELDIDEIDENTQIFGNNNTQDSNQNNNLVNNEEAPSAGFESAKFYQAFAEFNALTNGQTKFNKPDIIKEEFKTNFEGYKTMGDDKVAQEEFQKYLDNYYLAGLSNAISTVYKSDSLEKPSITDIAIGYDKMMSVVYDTLKDENYIDGKFPEFTFGNATPEKLMNNMKTVIDSMEANDIETAKNLNEQFNQYSQLINSYENEYYNDLPSYSEIINADKQQEEPRPSTVAAPDSLNDVNNQNNVEKAEDEVKVDKPQEEINTENSQETKEEINEVSKETKAAKVEYNFEKDFINELKAFEQATHIHIEIDDIKREFDIMKKIPQDANIDDPDLKAKVLDNAYSNFYKTNLSNALYTNVGNINNGTSFASPQSIANSFDRLMLAIDEEAKKAGIIKDNYVRDNPDTVSAETKYAETLRFCQNPKDRKEAEQAYNKAKSYQSKNVSDALHNEILDINKTLGTKFSSKGFVDHLAHKFKDVPSGDVNDMKADFPAKYKEFMQQAYTNMLSKLDLNNGKSIAEQTKAFDKLALAVENQCKQKGWLDMDYRHELNGGLNPEFIKKAQLEELNKRPQTTQEEAEKKLQTTNIKDVRKEMEELANKVPGIDKNGMNSIEAHTSVNYLRALDKKYNSRGFFNKLIHPIESTRERRALKAVTTKLTEKGYKRQDLENLIKNPLPNNEDPISRRRKEEVDAINAQHDLETNVVTKDKEADKLLQNVPGMDFRKNIEVPECDTRKEISGLNKDSKVSPVVQKEVDKQLETSNTIKK